MSKFKALADGIKQDRANFDMQADELLKRREQLRRRGETAFALHREHLDEVQSGLAAMESAIADIEGSNSRGNEEGSDDTSESFRKHD